MFFHLLDGGVMQLLSDEVVVMQRISNEKARQDIRQVWVFAPVTPFLLSCLTLDQLFNLSEPGNY